MDILDFDLTLCFHKCSSYHKGQVEWKGLPDHFKLKVCLLVSQNIATGMGLGMGLDSPTSTSAAAQSNAINS
jgi:hypothetical protein